VGNLRRILLLQRTQDIGSLCLVFALALAALSTTAKAQSLTKNPGLNEIGNVAPAPQQSPGAAAGGAAQNQLNSVVNQQGIGGAGAGLPGNVNVVPIPPQSPGTAASGAAVTQSQLNAIQSQLTGLINQLGAIGAGNVTPVPQPSQGAAAGGVGGIGGAGLPGLPGNVLPVPQPSPGAAASGAGLAQSMLNAQKQPTSVLNQQLFGAVLPGNVSPIPQASQGAVGGVVGPVQGMLNSIANQQGLGAVGLPGNVAPIPPQSMGAAASGIAAQSQLNGQPNSILNQQLFGAVLPGNVAPIPPQASQGAAAGGAGVTQSQLNSIQSQLGSLATQLGSMVAGNLGTVPQPSQGVAAGGVGGIGGVGLPGNVSVAPIPPQSPGAAAGGVGVTQSQLNSIQSQLGSIASQLGSMVAGNLGTVPQPNQGTASGRIGGIGGAGLPGLPGNVLPVPQNGGINQASINSQLSQMQSTLNSIMGGMGNPGAVPQPNQGAASGRIGGIGGAGLPGPLGNVSPVPQNAGVDAAMNSQLNQIRNTGNQILGNVLGGGGGAFTPGNGGVYTSPVNLNPSAPAFGGTLLNPPVAAPQASASDPGSLAVNTAVNIYVAVAGAAGITIPPGAVPVIQDLANCAMSGMTGNACANNVVVSAVLRELGVASLTPVANCLAGGGQPSACINPAALPSSVQPLANCILGGGNAGICAENATVVQALPKGAQQVMQTAMSTFSTVQVGSSSMQQPPGLANIVSIAGGIKSGDWGTVVAGVGSQNAGIAAQAVASSGLPPNVAGALGPILAAMAEGNAFQAGFSAFSKGDAVGMAEAAFQWYANQYLQAPCQAMPSGGFKDTVCGGAAAAINAVADVGGDIAKDILGIGKDILQFLGLWNAVDDVASGIWDGVTSVISDIGSLFGGKKVTVECVGWSTPSQYFGNVMASCMPNLASASGASSQAPDTSSVYNACVSYYDSCPAYNQQAVAANCQKIAGTLGTAAQNASNTLNAAAASYTTLGAGTFVANVYSDPTQRKYDNFCSGNFWPVERQQYAKQCAAALSKYFPSYAAAPSSNACPVQTASSAMQQACLNAIDSSSSKNLFAGSSTSLYCQEQQAAQVIVPATNAPNNWPCTAGNNAPALFVVAPLDLATAVPVMNATWQQPNKRKSNTTIGINIGIAANSAGCTPQSTAFKPQASAPFRSVIFGGFGSTGGIVNPNDGFGGPTIGGIASAIASAVAGAITGLPPQTGDSGSLSGVKGKRGTLKPPPPPGGGDSMTSAQKKPRAPPQQAAPGVGSGGTNGVSSSSAMDNAAAAAMGGGLASVAGGGGIGGPAIQGRPTKGGVTPTTPTGVMQAKNPPPKGGGTGGTNGTVSQAGAGKPSGGVASTSKPATSTSKPTSGATMPMTDYGGCAACTPPPPPPEVIK
jgi:hypothetical protein